MLAILSSNEIYLKLLISLLTLTVLAGIIWFYGPLASFQGYTPLAQPEKRAYAMVIVFLIWLLKFLIIDLDFPNTWQHKDPEVRRHLDALIKRFRGAMNFINTTSITTNGKPVSLQELPWFILLGPANGGKTALLAHSRIPFILQRQFTPSIPEHFKPSENCDWWLTREGGLIDVPSRYLFGRTDANPNKKNLHKLLWKFFLALIRKKSDSKNITGIAIALPLAEIMQLDDPKALETIANTLSKHINDIETTLHKKLPCHIIITKADLIPGFNEFFAESSEDEMTQTWGITLPDNIKPDDVARKITKRFNALVKNLNQQLLWRLHHERNPMARPPIKDFPLQMEKVKGCLLEFIKILDKNSKHARIHAMYFTSALQVKPEPETTIIDESTHADKRSIQIFQDPAAKSRAYFIKQLITEGLFPSRKNVAQPPTIRSWKQYAVYAASITAVIITSVLLGKDFKIGMDKTQHIQTNLTEYREVLRRFHNPNESMQKTLTLLNKLQKSISPNETKGTINRVLNYYSDKSENNASVVYHHALQAFLMPEIKTYFASYLEAPINKDTDTLYSVLKAYIMLGDLSHFDATYVRTTLTNILPASFAESKSLLRHFDIAVKHYQAQALDNQKISDTRKYLLSLRGVQLGYIILKSINSNTQNSNVLLGDNAQSGMIFNDGKTTRAISVMFTGRNFINVYEREIQTAAQEAATGNWILGTDFHASANPTYAAEIMDDLRTEYVKNYADTWETAIENIRLETPRNLKQADTMITTLTSYDSPLVKILNTVYENTYFPPVTTTSAKLLTLGQLVDKNNAAKDNLYQLLANLEGLHDYLQPVLTAQNPRKVAYELIAERMKHQGDPDPITKLRMTADQSPMPVKAWINQLSNDTWHFLLKNAMRYMDTSWSEQVIKPYQSSIANRYPFVSEAANEVSLKQFSLFFGKPGIITSFYSSHLAPFIDTSNPEWSWKKLDGEAMPFSSSVLHQIQQAMTIHHAFFPNGDNRLYVPFALQQQKISKSIQRIKLNINSKIIVDKPTKSSTPYVLAWPFNTKGTFSSIELTKTGKQPIETDYPGSWGWFKLVNHAYESSISNKEVILNFSRDKSPAQYLLSTKGKRNPFTALSLNHFHLAKQLTTISS